MENETDFGFAQQVCFHGVSLAGLAFKGKLWIKNSSYTKYCIASHKHVTFIKG